MGNKNSGRSRLPSSVLELRGTFDHNPARRRFDPPSPPVRIEADAHWPDEVRREWNRMVPELARNPHLGLRNADRELLRQLCETSILCRFASRRHRQSRATEKDCSLKEWCAASDAYAKLLARIGVVRLNRERMDGRHA
jgi:phage terminase small subunit